MNRSPSCLFKRAAFTLIEVLVVVAICLILISILLPALKSARDMGKQIACAGNMRQLGQGSIMYADASAGWFPCSSVQGFPAGSWCYLLAPYAEGRDWVISGGMPQNSVGVFFCASSESSIKTGPYTDPGSVKKLLSYGYNSYVFDMNYASWNRPMSRVQNPTTLFLMSDLEYPQYSNQPVPLNARLGNRCTLGDWDALTPIRHRIGSNVVFCDGHVDLKRIGPSGLPQGVRYYDTGSLH